MADQRRHDAGGTQAMTAAQMSLTTTEAPLLQLQQRGST
jgi:hypothetical protein